VLEFRILGPLEAAEDGRPLTLGGPKQRATLAILLLNANRVVSIDRLAHELYAGSPPVTAVTQVQRQISELRKALEGSSAIETRAPGYAIRLAPDELDLTRFERLTDEARRASAQDALGVADELLREALDLWRAEPLADLAGEPFALAAVQRLKEIRLAALEHRLDVGLALGRHRQLIPELEQLARAEPLRERLHAQLMVALYRSGRQAEALAAYRALREGLVEQLGIEPTPALRVLERAILEQNPALEVAPESAAELRTVLAVPSVDGAVERLLTVASPLLGLPGRELILARLVQDEREVEAAAKRLETERDRLPGVRAAAFTTRAAAGDVVRLATAYDAELTLADAPPGIDADQIPAELADLFDACTSDVGLLAGEAQRDGDGISVPFGGSEHDWAALETASALALATGRSLRLVGTNADARTGRSDASRLLADASLAVQRVVGVGATPMLADATEQALAAAVSGAWLVVVGIAPRWRDDGIGSMRRALVREGLPVLLVHGGPRPGSLAPRESRTRYTWSVAS
jgi:DNA-binding SARP family transcriptional activator